MNSVGSAASGIVSRKRVAHGERGALERLTPAHVTRAAGLVKGGRLYDLGLERYRGMPLPAVHPPFEILAYRSPAGLRIERDQAWIVDERANEARMAFNSEFVVMCLHTGTHLDSLAHITVGDDAHWFGGFNAANDLGDFGPLRADASTIPPIVTRGVLLDVARARGVDALQAHEGISGDELAHVADAQGTPVEEGDVVLVRTGYLGGWPNRERLADGAGAGITIDAARWLADCGAVVVGADTEAVEQIPTGDLANPHPVHSFLLIDRGILLLELADLERIAADGIHTFMFVGAPIKIRGGTAGLLDPVAIA